MLKLFLLFILISSCNPQEVDVVDDTELSGGSSLGLEISLDNISQGDVKSFNQVYYPYISGTYQVKALIGSAKIKYQVLVDDKLYSSGVGGVTDGEWVSEDILGDWSALNLQVKNKALNKVVINMSDEGGNSSSTYFFLDVDVDKPILEISKPLTSSSWVGKSFTMVEGTLSTNVGVKSFIIENLTNGFKQSIGVKKSWSQVITLAPGLNNIKVKIVDTAGGSAEKNIIIGSDLAGPSLSFTSPNSLSTFTTNLASPFKIQGSVDDSMSGVAYAEWTNLSTMESGGVMISGSTFETSAITPALGEQIVKISVFDQVGNVSVYNYNYILDQTAPSFKKNTFIVNENSQETSIPMIDIIFEVSDLYSNITSVCYKINDSTTPLSSDDCWSSTFSAAKDISLGISDIPLESGFGVYSIYLFAMDSFGNISNLEAVSGVRYKDKNTIEYILDESLKTNINEIVVANTNSASAPPEKSETVFSQNDDVYIFWNVEEPSDLESQDFSLYYTLDNKNWTLIQDSLSNTAQGCVLRTGDTGCYKWNGAAPSNNFFKVKLVINSFNSVVYAQSSNSVNIGKLNLLLGNTDLGLGGAGADAILFSYDEANYNDRADNNALVVSSSGYVFIRDRYRGILYYDPSDGALRLLAPTTGSVSGDGGSVFDASFKNALVMAIDHNDNILVWDSGVIRKIDLNTDGWPITTLIGGGSSSTSGSVATNLNLGSNTSRNRVLVPTPSGRIYFSKTSRDIWFYDPDDNKVYEYRNLSGLGTDSMGNAALSNFDNSQCDLARIGIAYNISDSNITALTAQTKLNTNPACGGSNINWIYSTNFNPNTGIAEAPHPIGFDSYSSDRYTGLDGNLYLMRHGRGSLMKYNLTTHNWDLVFGYETTPGRCEDGTPAASCNIKMMSLFVSSSGKIYFNDFGRVRYIDESNKVQTLFGQGKYYGIGKKPLKMRFAQLDFFKLVGNNLYAKDSLEQQIVKVDISNLETSTVEHLAGNGIKAHPSNSSVAVDSPISNCRWGMSCGFDVSNDESFLYHNSGGVLFKLNLTNGVWSNTGLATSSQGSVLAHDNAGNFLMYRNAHYGSAGNITTLTQFSSSSESSGFTIYGDGVKGSFNATTICNDGRVGTDCQLGYGHNNNYHGKYSYNDDLDSWLIYRPYRNGIHSLPKNGGVVTRFSTTTNNIKSFDYKKISGKDYIFYCDTSGRLFKRDVSADTEVQLDLGVPGLSCAGNYLEYSQIRNSLVFIYKHNYLYGIAEISSP